MIISPIKTHKITRKDKDILKILDRYIKNLSEKSIIAITSKIISITEGRIIKIQNSLDSDRAGGQTKFKIQNFKSQKDKLIKQESEYYLPREENLYHVSLTITRGNLVATAGIDESNGNGYYVLWPKNPQKSVNSIRKYLKKKFGIRDIGVIITDSKTTPLRWGVTGIAIAYSGFMPLRDYIGRKDIFGRKLEFTKMSIIDNLASACTLVMGEGNEQTPIVIAQDVPGIIFQKRNPTTKELRQIKISIKEDLYSALLKSVKWRRGNHRE